MTNETSDIMKGVVVGSLIGGAAGLLLAPKAGRKLRDDISNSYDAITHKFESNGQRYPNGSHNSMMTGAAIGAVVCAIAALLLAPKSGKRLREELGDKYEEIYERAEDFIKNVQDKGTNAIDHLDDWKDVLATLVDHLSNAKKRGSHASNLDTILDWANLGVQMLQQVKGRR